MAIRTCIDMIQAALRAAGILGVGQTALAEDATTGMELLQEVIGSWQRQRWMSWRLAEQVIPSTGALAYAMLDRPPQLESAFARLITGPAPPSISIGTPSPVDFPLQIIESQEDYNDIGLKYLSTFPAAVWYSPDYPVGSLWFWPVPPAAQFELHVFFRSPTPTYTALTDPLNLPPEYVRALRYELALLMQLNWGLPPNPQMAAALAGTKNIIKGANSHVRELSMPAGLSRGTAGSGGISGAVGPHQSVIVLDSGLPVLG